ncbi:MAG: nucleotidyltransferase [Verrucomicrobiota bacterium]
MGLFQTINLEARNRGLNFLVIGGLAVNFHAYSRETADLDILICRDSRDAWLQLFSELGYTIDQEKGGFIQFLSPNQEAWPIDLMLVNETTFASMFDNAKEVEMFGEKLLIPSLEHLIALKLHALKHSHAGRFMKDFLDVENLVRANKVDLRSNNIRDLFLKYGTLELYEKVSRACGIT